VLRTVADELVIAIQNTMSIEDVRKSNILLRQIDRVKDDFVSVASHELRTPMTVIRGFVDLLQREQLGPVNEKQQEILGKMSRNAKTLIDLVNDMLDLSKLEANKLEVRLSNSSLDELVKGALEKVRVLYGDKGITLDYNGVQTQITTDPEKFERIMLNLLGNANKFTQAGGRVVVTSSIDNATDFVTICVSDTGIGIPIESLDNLFKKFSQVDNYLQRQTEGTGLGLAICKQLVNRLGGTIWVKSTVGKGSQFFFTMPLASNNNGDKVS
jgi:signal transduction histidine kinase